MNLRNVEGIYSRGVALLAEEIGAGVPGRVNGVSQIQVFPCGLACGHSHRSHATREAVSMSPAHICRRNHKSVDGWQMREIAYVHIHLKL